MTLMSKRTPTVALTSDEVSCALRISTIFAAYGKPDSLTSEETNLVSVLGEFALSKHLYGDIAPVVDHRMESVRGAVLTGKVRDGHRDVPDAMVDVKASFCDPEKDWRMRHLMVPPYQLRSGVAYVSAVAMLPETGRLQDVREVVLAGWCEKYELRGPDPEHLGWWTCQNRLLYGMDSLRPEDWPVVAQASAYAA